MVIEKTDSQLSFLRAYGVLFGFLIISAIVSRPYNEKSEYLTSYKFGRCSKVKPRSNFIRLYFRARAIVASPRS